MNDKQEMIEKLKNTWTAFGGLGKEEQDFLKDNARNTTRACWRGVYMRFEPKILKTGFEPCGLYRLRPDFELPVEKKGRYVEYPIEKINGRTYMCIIKHRDNEWKPISMLQDAVGFGGVQFEGQGGKEWNMTPCLISPNGHLHMYSPIGSEVKPATPIRARFWVED